MSPESATRYQHQIKGLQVEIALLEEKVRLLTAQLFGRKSEKRVAADGSYQKPLFDEAEEGGEEKEEAPGEETVTVAPHERKKRGRRPLPEFLPRREVVHDLADEEKVCGCGATLERIGEETSEQLEMIPAKLEVIRHVRPKYACRACEGVESEGGAVRIAPVAAQLIPRSMATPSLLAHVLVTKFADAVPFYRQESQFRRLGIDIPRATMCHWLTQVAERSQGLLAALIREQWDGPLIQADETPLQVLKEPGRAATTKSYMWLFRGGPRGRPVVVYQYHPSRGQEVAARYLEGYEGVVQTDGYAGYDFLDKWPKVVHAGCWAHARRKFADVVRARGKESKGTGNADRALEFIRQLYAVEATARKQELSPANLWQKRQEESRPVLKDFEKWLRDKESQTPPKGLLGQAIRYTLNQWPRLVRYLDDAQVGLDNNAAENALRPFVVGRKNWLFAGNPRGAAAGALMYSLIETAKANSLEPSAYLRYVFDVLPTTPDEPEALRALLPNRLITSTISRHFAD